MSAGRTIRRRRRAIATVVSTALITVAGSTAAATPEDTPPMITGTNVDPSGLPPDGGLITITADVVDDVGVAVSTPPFTRRTARPEA